MKLKRFLVISAVFAIITTNVFAADPMAKAKQTLRDTLNGLAKEGRTSIFDAYVMSYQTTLDNVKGWIASNDEYNVACVYQEAGYVYNYKNDYQYQIYTEYKEWTNKHENDCKKIYNDLTKIKPAGIENVKISFSEKDDDYGDSSSDGGLSLGSFLPGKTKKAAKAVEKAAKKEEPKKEKKAKKEEPKKAAPAKKNATDDVFNADGSVNWFNADFTNYCGSLQSDENIVFGGLGFSGSQIVAILENELDFLGYGSYSDYAIPTIAAGYERTLKIADFVPLSVGGIITFSTQGSTATSGTALSSTTLFSAGAVAKWHVDFGLDKLDIYWGAKLGFQVYAHECSFYPAYSHTNGKFYWDALVGGTFWLTPNIGVTFESGWPEFAMAYCTVKF